MGPAASAASASIIIFACWDFVRKKLKLTTAVPFVVFLLFYGTAVMWPSSVIRATTTIALKIAGEGLKYVHLFRPLFYKVT